MALQARVKATGVIVLAGADVVDEAGRTEIFRRALRPTGPVADGLVQLIGSSHARDASDFGLEVLEIPDPLDHPPASATAMADGAAGSPSGGASLPQAPPLPGEAGG